MPLEVMPVTPEEVCSRAFVLCGLDPLTSFNDTGRDEIVVASQLYEVIVASCIGSYPWRFASGEQLLELSPDNPLDRFENAWHYPRSNQQLQIESIKSGDNPVSYDIMGNLIYANADETAELVAHYQFRQAEAYWQPMFTLYVIYRVAEAMAQAVTRNAKQITAFATAAETWFVRAKTRDAQSKTAKRSRPTALRRPRGRGPGFIAE